MKNEVLSPAASDTECRNGWIYFLLQALVISRALDFVNVQLGSPLDLAELNFVVFLMNFLAFGFLFRKFLLNSVLFAGQNVMATLFYAAIGVLGYEFWTSAVTTVIFRLEPAYFNANNSFLLSLAGSRRTMMIVSTVLLAPLAEECIYREMIFRKLLSRNRVLAFVISAGFFALSHVLGYIGKVPPMQLALSAVQYVPAGLFLAWTYCRTGSILGPLLMHMMINASSARQM